MKIYRENDIARRADNGRAVCVTEVRPIGEHVFYMTEDCQDGHRAILEGSQMRPWPAAPKRSER